MSKNHRGTLLVAAFLFLLACLAFYYADKAEAQVPLPAPVETIIKEVEVIVPGPVRTILVPGPVVTTPVPGPTVTVTQTARPAPAPTVTITQTAPAQAPGASVPPAPAPSGQPGNSDATVSPTPTQTPSPPGRVPGEDREIEVSINEAIGLVTIAGLVVIALVGMFLAYYRGYKDSESQDKKLLASLRDDILGR